MHARNFVISSIIFFIFLLSACSDVNKTYDLHDYIVEKEMTNKDALKFDIFDIKDRVITEYLKGFNIQFTHAKVSTIHFRESNEGLVPVSNDNEKIEYTLNIYNIKGNKKDTQNDVIVGIYEWDNYPNMRDKESDIFKINVDFNIPIESTRAIITYNTNLTEHLYGFSAYNEGYNWDIPKNSEIFPLSVMVLLESANPKLFKDSDIEYHFNGSENNIKDGDTTSTIIFKSKLESIN